MNATGSPNILQAMSTVFSARFKPGWLRADTWASWRVFLAAVFALPIGGENLEAYRKHTGRDDVPVEQFREVYAVVGRRGGKSAIAALVATFLAVFRDYSAVLAPGEQGVVMLLAADRRQARVLLQYINSFFDHVPMLKKIVLSRTKESLTLSNRIVIEVHTTSFRAIRGYTVVAAIADELAYWRSEDSANPDTEVLNALRPAMTTIPNALLLAISSPYARRGALWDAHKQYFGKPGAPVLVWQADTRTMNPTVSRSAIEREYERDPALAKAEYGAEFRTDIEAFLAWEAVESCVVPHRQALPPVPGVRYFGFVDPSGGSSDSMTLGIAHHDGRRAVLDLLEEKIPPFGPESVVREFAATLKRYGIHAVKGDRYGGEWPREQFQKQGITYHCSELNRSELYLELLPMITSEQVELLDNKRLLSQLMSLERRTSRLGRDSIDHPSAGHDDVANAAAGALVEALGTGTVRLTYTDLIIEQVAALEAAQKPALPTNCPACHSSCIVHRGPLIHCNFCGHELRIVPAEAHEGGRRGLFAG